MDGVTVKATLDGRGVPTPDPDAVPRELNPAETTETMETVTEFFPGLFPNFVRSDGFPDLFTTDRHHPLLGRLSGNRRIYCATGFSGGGFKNATGFGEIAAHEALGKSFEGLDLFRPKRFNSRQPAS